MTQRETEGTEINAMLLRSDGTQRNGRNGDKRNITEVPMAHRETEGTEINAILRRCR